jgi:hypothetical protein
MSTKLPALSCSQRQLLQCGVRPVARMAHFLHGCLRVYFLTLLLLLLLLWPGDHRLRPGLPACCPPVCLATLC